MPSTTLTYKYAISDFKLSLKIAFKDAEISTESVAFWTRTCENFIRQRHLKDNMTGAYLNEYYGPNAIAINTDGIKKWITIPGIYDLENEKGIDYIALNIPGVPFNKQPRCQQTFANLVDQLQNDPYEKPSPSNPYFYRVGNNVFLAGIETATIVNVNVGLYAAIDPRPIFLNPDSYLQINDEQYPILKEMILNLGKFVLVVPSQRFEVGGDQRNEEVKTFAKTQGKPEE